MKITVIGGGTGSSVVLEGLKKYGDLNLSVIVGMMDDGGSNNTLRKEFGLLPLSDIRKCIVSLSEENDNQILRNLFTYRFDKGKGLVGHTMGNLLMIAMTEVMGSEVGAIQMAQYLFGVRGNIIPVTLDDVKLVAEYEDGTKLVGENSIDEIEKQKRIKRLYLNKKASANTDALKAISEAEYIILGPGDIYTTILQNILVDGIPQEIQKSKAKIIYITNLMSKKGQTRGYTQKEILKILEDYLGRMVDVILCNNGVYPESILEKYKKVGESILEDDFGKDRRVLRTDLIQEQEVKKDKGDHLTRSLIRHDKEKLAKVLYRVFRGNWGGILSRFFSVYK